VNAFNSSDRQQIIDELFNNIPELSPYSEQWYVGGISAMVYQWRMG
jgi:hypothetical protein